MTSRSTLRISFVMVIAIALIGGIDQSTKNALKVQHILKKIEAQPSSKKRDRHTAEVTQTELNDYIKYLIKKEKEPHIKGINLVLFDKNQVRGRLKTDAEPFNLSFLFGDLLVFDFNGVLDTRKGKGRLLLNALKLNDQPVKPEMLDFIISAAAQYNGTEPSRISDWYELPKGIQRITVDKGKAILFY